MLSRLAAPVLVITLLASNAPAQAPHYQPTGAYPHGPELVMAYISSTWCQGNRAPGLHQAVDSLKLRLAAWAQAHTMTFRAVGVAIDWAPDSGVAYLKEFGKFDELVVGSNWFNLGAVAFIWADSTAPRSIPQVLVYRHDVVPGKNRVTIGTPQILKRVQGGDQVVQWVRAGAPLP
jgi:hypothetical protein